MACRNKLHKSKIEEFKVFVTSLGYELSDPVGAFEVARFTIPSNPMGIIFNGKSNIHYSVNNAAEPFVKKFIRHCRESKLKIAQDRIEGLI